MTKEENLEIQNIHQVGAGLATVEKNPGDIAKCFKKKKGFLMV